MTSEQLETARAERMRQNGHGALTLEDARTWIEETGLCLFLPRRQYSASLAPSFVEAVAGQQDSTPAPAQIALAEELLIRLEKDGVAVRLNLIGHPGEQPDYVVAAWVLPYVYALRGDRDWRRSPQLTGSRQVSPLAIQAYKRLEAGDATIAELTRFLGREVSETAVLRAITELWQQLRIIPVISAPRSSGAMAVTAPPLSESDRRGSIDLPGHRHLGAGFHLPAGRDCRQHGGCRDLPFTADRAQQDTRGSARPGRHAAGAYADPGPRSPLLRGGHIAGIRPGAHRFTPVRRFHR